MMVTLFLDFVSQGGWHGNGRPDTKQNTRGPCRVTNRDLEASIIQLAKRAYRYMYETPKRQRLPHPHTYRRHQHTANPPSPKNQPAHGQPPKPQKPTVDPA
jgi:hypothetical protein